MKIQYRKINWSHETTDDFLEYKFATIEGEYDVELYHVTEGVLSWADDHLIMECVRNPPRKKGYYVAIRNIDDCHSRHETLGTRYDTEEEAMKEIREWIWDNVLSMFLEKVE